MNDNNPWLLPKREGTTKYTFRLEPAYKQAIRELADQETQWLGVKVSMETIIFNLTTRNTEYIRESRIILYTRYKELKEQERSDNTFREQVQKTIVDTKEESK